MQRVQPAAHQHGRERAFTFGHMQEPGNGRPARNSELKLAHLARQALSRLFVGAIRQRLRLFGQLIAFQMWIRGNGIEVGRMQPVFAAARGILFLAGFLLPEHRLFRPLVDPVSATVAHHRIIEFAVGTLGFTHHDTCLHIKDFTGVDTAPDPHQAVNHAIPVRHVFTV